MSEIFQPVFVRTREKVISVLRPMFSNEAITSAESFSDLDFRSENFLMSKSWASQRGSKSRAPTSPFDVTASFQISCANRSEKYLVTKPRSLVCEKGLCFFSSSL